MSATFVEARPIDSDGLAAQTELAPTSARNIRTAIIVAARFVRHHFDDATSTAAGLPAPTGFLHLQGASYSRQLPESWS